MKGTILIITGFRDNALYYRLISGHVFHDHVQKIGHLDKDLLQLIESLTVEAPIEGILVDRSSIQGFASIRLLLTTLNFIAWIRDIPILSIDDFTAVCHNLSFVDDIHDMIQNEPHFAKQLVPNYAAPADITSSKRSIKFTIS